MQWFFIPHSSIGEGVLTSTYMFLVIESSRNRELDIILSTWEMA
jgi:hypothetical protein